MAGRAENLYPLPVTLGIPEAPVPEAGSLADEPTPSEGVGKVQAWLNSHSARGENFWKGNFLPG